MAKTYVITRSNDAYQTEQKIENVARISFDPEGSSYTLIGIDNEYLAIVPLGTFDMIHEATNEKEATE